MKRLEYCSASLATALELVGRVAAAGHEVKLLPRDTMFLIRAPISAIDAFPAEAQVVKSEAPAADILRALVDTIDEMRSASPACIADDYQRDGPDHWFGRFTNFNVDGERSVVAISWPNLSIVAAEGTKLLSEVDNAQRANRNSYPNEPSGGVTGLASA